MQSIFLSWNFAAKLTDNWKGGRFALCEILLLALYGVPISANDFDKKYESAWVTVPNSLWDSEKADGLYQEYIDPLVYGEELGFDGLVLN